MVVDTELFPVFIFCVRCEVGFVVDDLNELDDTSKNPLLRNAGSNEDAEFERYLLKQELNDEYGLGTEDFKFAEEYFDEQPNDRKFLYTNVTDMDASPRPGVFGLAHLWFKEEKGAPLGRVRRAFYYKPFGDDVKERPVRMLGFDAETQGEQITGDDVISRVLADREDIEGLVDERLEAIRQKGHTSKVANIRKSRKR
jgi:hypothetical protein